MFTLAEENYLKAIYHLEFKLQGTASTNAIAEKLEAKASSVTDMVQKLAEKNVVSYTKYKGTHLTSEGRKIAAKVVRKHRLWEVFLVDKLSFSWDEVHEIAEELEHIKSKKLIDRLDSFLEFPKVLFLYSCIDDENISCPIKSVLFRDSINFSVNATLVLKIVTSSSCLFRPAK